MLLGTLGLEALGRPARVLALSAHPDDVEIGAGGTLLALSRRDVPPRVRSLVLTGTQARAAEARAAAAAFSGPHCEVDVLGLDDGFLPGDWARAKGLLRDAAAGFAPDLVLAPRREDAHQDHRVVAELAWQLFRGCTVLEYEVPKWDGDLGRPSAYVPLDDALADRKLALLAEHFPSQRHKPWYDEHVFRGLLRLRGLEAGVRWAEAFTARKLVVRP